MGKALILACVLLAGCETVPAPVENPRRVWCDHNEPRRPTRAAFEAMSRADLDEMNAHNKKGVEWCRWAPSATTREIAFADVPIL